MAKLFYADGDERPQWVPVGPDKAVAVVGRAKDCDIRTNNNTVSRRHCQVRFRDGRYLLQDLNSSNGTSYNSERIHELLLNDGDVFLCGNFEVKFELDEHERAHQQREAARSVGPGGGIEEIHDEDRVVLEPARPAPAHQSSPPTSLPKPPPPHQPSATPPPRPGTAIIEEFPQPATQNHLQATPGGRADDANDRLAAALAELEAEKTRSSQLRAEARRLQDEVDLKRIEIDSLNNALDDLRGSEEELDRLRQANQGLEGAVESLRAQVQAAGELQRQFERASESAKQRGVALSEAQDRVRELESALTEAQANLLANSQSPTHAASTEEIDALYRRIGELEQQQATASQTSESAERQVALAQQRAGQLEEALRAERAELTRLRAELTAERAATRSAGADQSAMQAAQSESARLAIALAGEQARAEALEADLRLAREHEEALQTQLLGLDAAATKVPALEAINRALQQSMEQTKAASAVAAQALGSTRAELTEWRQRAEKAERALTSVSQTSELETMQLRLRLEAAETTVQTLSASLDALQTHPPVDSQSATLASELNEAKAQAAAAQEAHRNALARAEAADQQAKAASNAQAVAVQELERLKQAQSASTAQTQQAEAALAAVRQEVERLQQQLSASQSALAEAKVQAQSAPPAETEKLQRERDEAVRRLEEMAPEYESMKATHKSLVKRNAQLLAQVKGKGGDESTDESLRRTVEFERQLKDATGKLESMQAVAAEAKAKVTALEGALAAAEAQAAEHKAARQRLEEASAAASAAPSTAPPGEGIVEIRAALREAYLRVNDELATWRNQIEDIVELFEEAGRLVPGAGDLEAWSDLKAALESCRKAVKQTRGSLGDLRRLVGE